MSDKNTQIKNPVVSNEDSTMSEIISLMSGMNPETRQLFLKVTNRIMETSSEVTNDKEDNKMPTLKEGTIRRRKDGRYEGRYMHNGKQKSVYARTQRDCINKLRKAIKNRGKNNTIGQRKQSVTLKEWFDEWVTLYKGDLNPQSKLETTRRYELYMHDAFGNSKLRSLTTFDLQKHFAEIAYPTQRAKLFREMKSVFQKARINGFLTNDPMEGVEIQKNHKVKQEEIPTPDKLEKFLSYLEFAKNDLKYLVEFDAFTGLRVGELLALEINDLDFTEKTITVNKAINRNTNVVGKTKTDTSVRVIPLSDRAETCIKEYIDVYKPKEKLFYMFKSANLTNLVRYHTKKFGFEGVSIHTFRKFFSTICRSYGIDVKVVQKWLGHKNANLTLDVYTQVHKDLWLKEADKFNLNSSKQTLN